MDEFFQWLNDLFRRPTELPPLTPCTHEKVIGPITVIIRGEPYTRLAGDRCPACTQAYAERYAITCATCHKPILPGMPVGRSGQRRHPYVHTEWNCMWSGSQYCGMWGEGRLITLNELDPAKYPPGTDSLLDVVSRADSTITETIP